jgi:5-methylcytosine-specific restriction endonuclease McrA
MGLQQKTCECGVVFFTAKGRISECRNCRRLRCNETSVLRRLRRVNDAPGSHTHAQWMNKVRWQGGLCYWCHRKLRDPEGVFRGTRDHLMPLVKGGSDSIDNIVATCWPCNREKGVKTPGEYRIYLAQHGRSFSEVSTLRASTDLSSADIRKALKRSAELTTLQLEQRAYVSDPHPKNLPPLFRNIIETLSAQKTMDPQTHPGKKRNQAIADLNQYLAEKRRPQDETERQKLLKGRTGGC